MGGAWLCCKAPRVCVMPAFPWRYPLSLKRRKEWDQGNRSTMTYIIFRFPGIIWDIYWVPPDLARISAISSEVVWGRQDHTSRLCSIICTWNCEITGDLYAFPLQASQRICIDKGRDMYSWVSEEGICHEGVTRAQMLTGDNRITWLGDKRLPQGSIIDLTACT